MSRAAATDTSAAVTRRGWLAEAEAAAGIARQLVGTPFIPDSLCRWHRDERTNKPVALDIDGTVATAAAALLAGQELGFGPMASLRSIDVIRGTPALRAIALRALVQQHGHDIWVVFSNTTRATVRARRAGGEVQEVTWTLDRAKGAALYPGKEDSQWRRNPAAMLVARATAEVARWVAADSILGIPYIAEELADEPLNGSALPADVAGDEAEGEEGKPKAKPRAKAPARTTKTARAALPPAPPMPPPPPTPPPEDQAPPPDKAPPPKGRAKRTAGISAQQLAALHVKLREAGIGSRTDAQAVISAWIDRAVASSNDLTHEEATAVLARLDETIAALEQPPASGQPADQTGEEATGDDHD
jgi:hypothetical protein